MAIKSLFLWILLIATVITTAFGREPCPHAVSRPDTSELTTTTTTTQSIVSLQESGNTKEDNDSEESTLVEKAVSLEELSEKTEVKIQPEVVVDRSKRSAADGSAQDIATGIENTQERASSDGNAATRRSLDKKDKKKKRDKKNKKNKKNVDRDRNTDKGNMRKREGKQKRKNNKNNDKKNRKSQNEKAKNSEGDRSS